MHQVPRVRKVNCIVNDEENLLVAFDTHQISAPSLVCCLHFAAHERQVYQSYASTGCVQILSVIWGFYSRLYWDLISVCFLSSIPHWQNTWLDQNGETLWSLCGRLNLKMSVWTSLQIVRRSEPCALWHFQTQEISLLVSQFVPFHPLPYLYLNL